MIRRSSRNSSGTFLSEGSANRKTSRDSPASWLRQSPTTLRDQRSLSTAVCCGTTRNNSDSEQYQERGQHGIKEWKLRKGDPDGDRRCRRNAGYAGKDSYQARGRGGLAFA